MSYGWEEQHLGANEEKRANRRIESGLGKGDGDIVPEGEGGLGFLISYGRGRKNGGGWELTRQLKFKRRSHRNRERGGRKEGIFIRALGRKFGNGAVIQWLVENNEAEGSSSADGEWLIRRMEMRDALPYPFALPFSSPRWGPI
ncbi:hypothetical protein CEXT_814511 [Caerostris extrusa]|uniref:Uncharacterized protein n=1 Tax=Caerostris extrusa TaxID=172846 RepID=A0AAV4N9Q1_CAEEX|nr:hypothetical protein CEXT_814511 [Caerostris extrusa]